MTIKASIENNVIVLELDQERLDILSVPAFKEAVADQLMPGKNVIIDLHAVQFIDSTGLGALLSAQRSVKATKGKLMIANASEQALAMLRLVKMNRVLDIYITMEEAFSAANS